ncbi:prepilin-type N-terminal cleavage/methylation domain-containing protein [Rhizobium sp. NLR9b]|uniref:prepilin-type N-terminal cleavage/methylation domain-containing protein n=1 Tax=unclassified Rhizobium TaxID=2613769 RepID=UPI001C82F9F1|nr:MULTISPECIES: prepilin-type N-terminal cleavage/methylation domain-containing protein [unclassified Rhizobium]MBX5230572.1 prepilin-type N-terminal cleavage/methylation domain-containing protein [Rhizobium sp. NLR9b]MBX5291240.1 prepilin-type N-terminal cleavage/methylation domain-containing protein [Rhizobium sp. NLR10b]
MTLSVNSRKDEEGFTLVEMLVTLALLAALSAVMIGAITQFRPLRRLTEGADGQTEMIAAIEFLQQTIADARSVYLLTGTSEKRLAFEGTSHSLHFPTVLRVGTDQLALRDVLIELQENGGSVSIVLRDAPRRLGRAMPAPVSFSIIEDIVDAHFEFMDAPQPPEGQTAPTWLNQWNRPEKMPYAVKITLEANRGTAPISAARIAFLR